jgi:hypothetical protein
VQAINLPDAFRSYFIWNMIAPLVPDKITSTLLMEAVIFSLSVKKLT